MFTFVFSFFFSSRRRHTISKRDWSSDVCSSDLPQSLSDHHVSFLGPFRARARGRCLTSRLKEDTRSGPSVVSSATERSEERRVGKECRSRWSPEHQKKKTK